ncbi:MAG: 3-dehydroquinate synthase [Hyphomonadaceae bacterium]|nr:3-dehydroquinate synthase [Hyphomonadaceae bacterium]
MTQGRTVRVALGARAYDVVIGRGLLAGAGARLAPLAPGGRVAIVVDDVVAKLHLSALMQSCFAAGLSAHPVVVSVGEGAKSFAGLERLIDALLELNLERRDLVVAFGGGVVGDLAGLAAALLKRGLDFVQIPTTLLAQVDSSVGGKTAINAAAGKNLVGVFHQPRLVLADLDVLATLPERERRAGYAEIVKIGLIRDAQFYAWCERHAHAVIAGVAGDALAEAVATAVAAKAAIVAEDEREAGVRALLNLGHTFAHAIEACAGMDGAVLHGEAVGCGMALAFRFSARLGHCPPEDSARVDAHLAAAGFATRLAHLPAGPYPPHALIAAMRHDKKNEAGGLTFILARAIGDAFVAKSVDEAALGDFLAEHA